MREIRTANPPTTFASIDDFLERRDGVRGTVEIDLHGLPLHFFYDWRGADTTLVTLSGTASARMEYLPAWGGDGISRPLGVNRILVSDPSLILSTELRLGWYGGNSQQPRLQEDLAHLLAGVTAGTRPILFGPSGGGFAALVQGAVLPGATVVASNPQTDVSRFTKAAVDRYMDTAWSQAALDPAWTPFLHEVCSLYQRPTDSMVIYVQNAGDADHIERHYSPFRDTAHSSNRIVYLMPNLGPGHIGPDKPSFTRLLETVRDHAEWGSLLPAVRDLSITRDV